MIIDTNEPPAWAVERIRDLEREIAEWESGERYRDKNGHVKVKCGPLVFDQTRFDEQFHAALNEWTEELRERNRKLREEISERDRKLREGK